MTNSTYIYTCVSFAEDDPFGMCFVKNNVFRMQLYNCSRTFSCVFAVIFSVVLSYAGAKNDGLLRLSSSLISYSSFMLVVVLKITV